METTNPLSPVKANLPFLAAILISITGGALVGIITALVGSFLYIVLLFPLGMGTVGGSIVTTTIKWAKLRKSKQLVILSLLTAFAMYGTYHYGRYVALQSQTFLELSSRQAENTSPISAGGAKFILDYALLKATGHSGFLGYMLYKAQQGVSLSRLVSGSHTNLGPFFTWIYWLLEFGLIVWVIVNTGRKEILIPVCEVCGSRFGKEQHLGGTSPANESLMMELIHRREFSELVKLIDKNADVPSTELYLQRCGTCGKGNSYVTVRHAFKSSRGALQFSDASKITLLPQDGRLLMQNLPAE